MKSVNTNLLLNFTPIRETIEPILGTRPLSLLMFFAILYLPFLFNYGWGYRNTQYVDLPSFHSASVVVFEHGESPYDRESLQSLSGEQYVFPYLYPPPSLLLLYPLSAMDYATARHVVLTANHLLILALLWAIPWFLLCDRSGRWRVYESRRSRGGAFVVFAFTFAYSLTFHPTVVTLNHGQVNLLLLVFLLSFWILANGRKPISASLFLALAVVLKTYPLVILPMLLVAGRKRECAYTSAWLVLWIAVSLLILPSAIWHDWLVNVLPTGGYANTPVGLFSPAAIWNQSLNGFFARALTENQWSSPVFVDAGLARHLTYVAGILVAAVSGVAVWYGRKVRRGDLSRTMLVALPAMYLIAPYSWEHHLVYLLPSILILLTSRVRLRIVAATLFYSLSVGSAVLIGMNGALNLKFYGVAGLWVLCIFAACNRSIQLPNERTESDE